MDDRDATFILLYAIILLNVDQHNPKNKKPMTLQDFIRNQVDVLISFDNTSR